MNKTPILSQLLDRKEEVEPIGKFLQFCSEKGYVLGRVDDGDFFPIDPLPLVIEYLGIETSQEEITNEIEYVARAIEGISEWWARYVGSINS